LESRVQFALNFSDYTKDELSQITLRFAEKQGYCFESDALVRFSEVVEYYRNQPNFANARTVRNILEQVILNQNLRAEDDVTDNKIVLQDVDDYVNDEGIL
jgi:Holliday junction resolvasome RuvABC ATP-dependent DNA helicase subunit